MVNKKFKMIIILSGGMDSAICLALAVKKYGSERVMALTFDYGQRHRMELKQAKIIAKYFQVAHSTMKINFFKLIGKSALLNKNIKIKKEKNAPPNTMVTGRNGIFALIGAMVAHQKGASAISMGVMGLEAANSGYPDCSPNYISLIENVIRLDLQNKRFKIHTPLINLSKKETMGIADKLGVLEFLWKNTISCYEGLREKGCEKCPACILRNAGIKEYLSSLK